jgi:hypothetical protein
VDVGANALIACDNVISVGNVATVALSAMNSLVH